MLCVGFSLCHVQDLVCIMCSLQSVLCAVVNLRFVQLVVTNHVASLQAYLASLGSRERNKGTREGPEGNAKYQSVCARKVPYIHVYTHSCLYVCIYICNIQSRVPSQVFTEIGMFVSTIFKRK